MSIKLSPMIFFLLFSFLIVVGCSSCFQRSTQDRYEFKCIATNSATSYASGLALYEAALERGESVPSTNGAQTDHLIWMLGASNHLDSRFTSLGQRGYTFVGIGMYDPQRQSTWVCFQRKK